MQKKINKERLVEITRNFKEIHLNSSRTVKWGNWFKIQPFSVDGEFDNDLDESFMMEIKPLLISLRIKYKENLLNIGTFLFDDQDKLENIKYNSEYSLNLKEYLDIIEKSTSYSHYLTKLIDKGYDYYTRETLNYFTSKYLFNDYIALEMIVEIKDIKLVKNYQYPQEKGRFDDIEYHWEIREYDEVFNDVYKIFPNFFRDPKVVENWLKENNDEENENTIVDKSKDIPIILEKMFNKIISDCEIPELSKLLKAMVDKFNGVIKAFSIIRGMLGKDQGKDKKNEKWLKAFENASEINRRICSRIIIDLMKVSHNALLIADIENTK